MRVVLDTNVVVSSYLNVSGPPGIIREAFRRQDFEVVVSGQLLDEYQRALTYPKVASLHRLSPEEIAQQVAGIQQLAVLVTLEEIPAVIPEDPADNVILATALTGEAEYIISGDQDLLRLGQYQDIEILPPAAFLAVITYH